MDCSTLLAAYDAQLRTDAETPSALTVVPLGPLRLVTFGAGRGFVTYQDLGGADDEEIRHLVSMAMAHFISDPAIRRVEWKTRGHDRAPGLHEALMVSGFTPECAVAPVVTRRRPGTVGGRSSRADHQRRSAGAGARY